jgi:anti-anti-sigma factor
MNEEQITQRQIKDDTILITAPRALDNSNAHQMLYAITCAQAARRKFIILDMANLEFISSAGVGSILGTVESSREIGGDIILCNVMPNVLHVLQVLDLTDYLTIKVDLRDAEVDCNVK